MLEGYRGDGGLGGRVGSHINQVRSVFDPLTQFVYLGMRSDTLEWTVAPKKECNSKFQTCSLAVFSARGVCRMVRLRKEHDGFGVMAVVYAFEAFRVLLSGHVRMVSDNRTVVAYINHQEGIMARDLS